MHRLLLSWVCGYSVDLWNAGAAADFKALFLITLNSAQAPGSRRRSLYRAGPPRDRLRMRRHRRLSTPARRLCMWPSATTWSGTGARRSQWSRRCRKRAASAEPSLTASATASATPFISRGTSTKKKAPSSPALSANPKPSPSSLTPWYAQVRSRGSEGNSCSASNSAAVLL